jgi:hypothetical protein
VRGPNKREWLENYLLSKLPYYLQWYRTRTRFDTLLTEPLNLGTVQVAPGELNRLGTSPPVDTAAQMSFLDMVSSAEAHVGDAVQGELSEPLFPQPMSCCFHRALDSPHELL